MFVREDEVYVCGRNWMQEPPEDPADALPESRATAFLRVHFLTALSHQRFGWKEGVNRAIWTAKCILMGKRMT